MNLQMFINDRLIGSMPIDQNLASKPEYIYQKKKELEEKYRDIVEASDTTPSYSIEMRSTTENRRRKP